ncbi:MAG: MarR family winged helix-turn-helix transcriptional regulator [Acidimicrobiales bacterium]
MTAGEQAENLLGALSLAITDRMDADSADVALSALQHILDRPSIDRLARVLGLSSSGTVRLVDRLAAAGYVERTAGVDRRTASITLTPAGRREAERVSTNRQSLLRGALSVLSPAEREQFGALAGRVLAGMVRPPGATRWTCRLCDTGACGRPEGRCPVATAAGWRPDTTP